MKGGEEEEQLNGSHLIAVGGLSSLNKKDKELVQYGASALGKEPSTSTMDKKKSSLFMPHFH